MTGNVLAKLPAKRSGNRKLAGAKRNQLDEGRMNEQIATVTQSLGQHFVERWKHLGEMMRQIVEMMAESETRIRATRMVTERDQHLIEIVRTMFEKLPKLPRLRTPEERWERSGHTETAALLGMLYRFEATLPPALFDGLIERLRQQPCKHTLRWALVYEARFVAKLSWQEAYKHASERLAGTLASGSVYSMKRSYQLATRRWRAGTRRDFAGARPG